MFKGSANYAKLKTNMRLAINRFKLLEKKKTELTQKARREIADYISNGKEDRARIRVEHIIREDYLVEAMELLEMYCDLLLARFGLIQTQKELDPGLEESIASILWATPRLQTDVVELKAIFDQFALKYGKEFAQACRANTLSNVNEKVMHKLSVHAPPKVLVERYMIEIAKNFNVPFEPDPTIMQSDEIYAAENLLLDYDAEVMKNPNDSGVRPGGSGGAGGGGGQALPPRAQYQPPIVVLPPPLPTMPPAGPSLPYPTDNYPPPAFNQPPQVYPPPARGVVNGPPGGGPVPSYNEATNQRGKTTPMDNFPELPSVPSHTVSTVDVGTTSAGGEDVDFDDLTRRFEDLKKKK